MKNICEICCEDFSVSTKHNTFKCWKTEPHLICKTCCEKESERRKTNGQNDFLFYCSKKN